MEIRTPPGLNGLPGTFVSNVSHGMTPFGFAFGGAANAGAVSSYIVRDNGTPTLETGSVPTHQTAACWVVVTPYGRFAYTISTAAAP
ncbi:MAG: hypothetical protein ABJC09_17150 [Terriglobia bacterium]